MVEGRKLSSPAKTCISFSFTPKYIFPASWIDADETLKGIRWGEKAAKIVGIKIAGGEGEGDGEEGGGNPKNANTIPSLPLAENYVADFLAMKEWYSELRLSTKRNQDLITHAEELMEPTKVRACVHKCVCAFMHGCAYFQTFSMLYKCLFFFLSLSHFPSIRMQPPNPYKHANTLCFPPMPSSLKCARCKKTL